MSKLSVTSDAPGEHIFMLGNEAIARGAIEAGVQLAAAYPGTPSSEIVETLAAVAGDTGMYVEWSTNEKVAFDPGESGLEDHIGLFAVTTGLGIETKLEEFEAAHDDYQSILLKALADRLAEAFAEHLHWRIRKEFWRYSSNETLKIDELIKETYRGIRPAPGYPACPDHSEKKKIFRLLNAEKNAGMELTSGYAMLPASSVSGYYFAHPRAEYFILGPLLPDQLEDYARRKECSVDEVSRLLPANLHS